MTTLIVLPLYMTEIAFVISINLSCMICHRMVSYRNAARDSSGNEPKRIFLRIFLAKGFLKKGFPD